MVTYQQIFKNYFDAKRQDVQICAPSVLIGFLVSLAQQLPQSHNVRVISLAIIIGQSDIRDIEQWLEKVSLEQLILEYGAFSESFSF